MIPYLTADNITHPTFAHGFFTREGGVSDGLYASLNCGYGSGDMMENVRENRQRVAKALGAAGSEVMTCHQIHSSQVQVIKQNTLEKWEADGLVTNIPGIILGILTADCVPVLFADVEAKIIGAAHAGWRGAQRGILQQTIKEMENLGAAKNRIKAAIGPCIAQASYEVGADVVAAFTSLDAAFSSCFRPGQEGARYWFDVGWAVEMILTRSGVANITRLGYDTYAEEMRFFSFRRATHRNEPVYGRQISAIMLK